MWSELRPLLLTWAGLLALLAITIAASFAPIGSVKPVANMAIAAVKAGLILWVFMHLRERGGLMRIFALGAIAWLAVLMGLAVTDILTR
ncbi:cytochrome C oxidase subunit IV family protein [Inquilinus sp.]|uniref:cytochrome C oxidase subunit IV family protein n=1 Tax=Inquilinus sp. TaxID=1932117 RepID=UPI0031E31DC2